MKQEATQKLERINELQKIIADATLELESLLGIATPKTNVDTEQESAKLHKGKPKREHMRYGKRIPDMIRDALSVFGGVMSENEIRQAIRTLHGVTVKRTSISAALSGLKQSGVAVHVGTNAWRINTTDAPKDNGMSNTI